MGAERVALIWSIIRLILSAHSALALIVALTSSKPWEILSVVWFKSLQKSGVPGPELEEDGLEGGSRGGGVSLSHRSGSRPATGTGEGR